MTKEEIKDLGKVIGQKFIDELDSYGLDFDLREPNIALWGYLSDDSWEISIEIVGHELPDDIIATDDQVFERMLNDITDEYISSHNIKANIGRCNCFIYETPRRVQTHTGNGFEHIENVLIWFSVYIEGVEW